MYLKNNIVTFFLYSIATIALIEMMNEPNQTLFIWPAAGIGVITALVWGIRILPGLYLALLLINMYLLPDFYDFFTLSEFLKINLFITASLFRCYFGAFLIRYFIGYPNSLISYQAILKLFFIIAPVLTFVSTLYFEIINIVLNYHDFMPFSEMFFDWWIGDYLGFIIFAPLTMILIAQPKSIWQPRYLTVGLPLILTFIAVIIIYIQSYENEHKRIVDNLKIKNELLITKINESNNWVNQFLNYTFSHFLPQLKDNTSLTSYLNSLSNIDFGANALVWFYKNDSDIIKMSKEYDEIEFNQIKTYNFLKIIDNLRLKDIPLYSTQYIKELNQFVNVFELKKTDSTLTIIAVHDFTEEFEKILSDIGLNHINLDLEIIDGLEQIKLINSNEILPKNKIEFENTIKFHKENLKLIVTPSANYFNINQSTVSKLLAQIGLLFAGLIGVMLLIITGKTTLTDIRVKERTLDLDQQTKDLKESKKQYQFLIEQHPVILWRQNIDTNKMTYISKKVTDLYGYSLKEWLDVDNFWLDHIHSDDQKHVKKKIKLAISKQKSFELEYRLIKSDGNIAWIKDSININIDRHSNTQLVGLMIDTTETKEAIFGQNISESKYRTLFKHAVDPLVIIDIDLNLIKDSNDKAISLFGLNNINGQVTLSDFSPIYQPDGGKSKSQLLKIFRNLSDNRSVNLEWRLYDKSHNEIICFLDIIKLPNQTDNIILVNINDITETKQHERKINQLAYYDNLTKLPNREYFYSKFEYFHDRAIKENKYGTIIYLDLDRFKILNDSLGHQAGDILLKMVAKRIRNVSKKKNFCARLAGDEFVILTKKLENSIESILEKTLVNAELILEALNEPYQLEDYEHIITPSIGISYFPMNDVTTDQVIHQADIAMYSSKSKGKNTITIYQDNMVKLVNERLIIEKAVRQAIDNNDFELNYQPQFNEKNEIFAVEALLRWDKAKSLNINTENIIETIEKIGLTHELGYWVFDNACAQLEDWQNQGHSIKSISINVSAKQFHQKLFVDQIISVVESYNIKPSQIILELTEAVIIDDMVSLIEKLNKLREYGVRSSLDDFGTGYSSLAYLKHLPINQLKIDKMFIHDLSFEKSSQHIVKTIIDLAQSLNIELIAEGIEIKQQYEILKNLGCKNFQGFYFSKPLPGNKVF